MDFNATVDLIIKDLNDATGIIDDLKNYPGVPLIQVELAKSKCRSAADIIALLKNMKNESEPREVMPESEPVPEQVGKKEKPMAREEVESTIVADTFGLSDRINEKIGIRRDNEGVPDILKSKPLVNLSEAIGVNDRFLFIREVFNGNNDAYNQAITRLDNSASLEDARAVIMSYRGDNKETDAIRQLLVLVKRKFQSDE